MKPSRKQLTYRRHRRIRKKVTGSQERPRLSVFRSNNHIYAQVIDDVKQHTLASASTVDPDLKGKISSGGTCEASSLVGALLAERSLKKGINQVVFDRGGNIYHGRVKALADAAREAGLDF
ncbi:50S ribosomal protein L18 [Spirulina sp. CS-785/01]|uniref:50S ribosomal protein L18 n=1 Tax=Spirulina sp. CS-785/01 TaxID=3021716 RepID=UPI00232C6255|nr:50S ribosomal protein L18 [Spirulina sp. CS-785/01]MDB9312271.1 50S ribosomal protein L18 [Spirulina sp. CS-785/01]